MVSKKSILILGGSNAGLGFGWAAQLQRLAPEVEIKNCFLGGSGSLYALAYLLKLKKGDAPLPDLILVEYTLNDIVFFEAGQLSLSVIEATLREILSICAQLHTPILFLGLTPRLKSNFFSFRSPACRVKKIYRSVLSTNTQSLFVDLNAVLGLNYLDDHHLTEKSSETAAGYLLEFINHQQIQAPPASMISTPNFTFVLPSSAESVLLTTLEMVEAPVYCGEFLKIKRGGSARWRQTGRLVGILLRSTNESGVYTIKATGQEVKKSAQSKMREIVPNLILMHNLATTLYSSDMLDITMPRCESDLEQLPEDRSLLVCVSPTDFENQTLELGGLLFWITAQADNENKGIKKFKAYLSPPSDQQSQGHPPARVTSDEKLISA